MNRYAIIAFTLVIAGNAFVLGRAAWNRSEIGYQLPLTERELRLPWRVADENSGISMQLAWLTLKPGVPQAYPQSLYTSDAKMAELGFDPGCGMSLYDVERNVWYVLEFDGATFRQQLELGEQSLAREREEAAKPNASEYRRKSIEGRAKGFENQREFGSRLYVTDVDTDRTSLEKKYAGRDDIAILPGTLGCMNGSLFVRNILVDTVNVPRELRAVVEDLTPIVGFHAPRFTATIAFGKLGEPWIVDMKPIAETEQAGAISPARP